MSIVVSEGVAVRVDATREQLLPALTALAKVVGTRPSIPILSGAMLDADTGTIWATNYEAWASCRIPVSGEGQVLLPVHGLLAAVKSGGRTKKAMAEVVTIEVADGTATVKVGGVVVPLMVMDAKDYPEWPKATGAEVLTTDVAEWRTAWDGVVWATAPDRDGLPILGGVHFTCSTEGLVQLEATDRYRAARHPVAADVSMPWAAVIPGNLAPMMAVLSGQLVLKAHGSGFDAGLSFTDPTGNVVYTRLIDGDYPKIANIWPDRGDFLEFDRDALIAAVKQVLPHVVRNSGIRLEAKARQITVSTLTDDGLSVTAEPIRYDGEDLTWSHNPKFLLDVLKALPVGTVRTSYTDPNKPFRFESGASPLDVIVMPVRLTS